MKTTVVLLSVLHVISLLSASEEDESDLRSALVSPKEIDLQICCVVRLLQSNSLFYYDLQRLLKENASPIKLLMQLAEKIVRSFRSNLIILH